MNIEMDDAEEGVGVGRLKEGSLLALCVKRGGKKDAQLLYKTNSSQFCFKDCLLVRRWVEDGSSEGNVETRKERMKFMGRFVSIFHWSGHIDFFLATFLLTILQFPRLAAISH